MCCESCEQCGESPTDLVHTVVLLEEHEGGLGGEVVGLVPVPQVFTDHLTERLPVAAAHWNSSPTSSA